jgi:hypothetical protein
MPFDLGLGFELETMHIVAIVGVIVLAVGAFFYFRSRGSNHVQFEDSLNEEFPREKEQCDEEKCVIK